MEPGRWDPTILRGADWTASFRFLEPTGANRDLSGVAAARADFSRVGSLIVSLHGAPAATIDAAAARVSLRMTAAQTTALACGRYDWALDLLGADGSVERQLVGEATVE